MKTLIAATVIALSSGSVLAGGLPHETFGGPELNSFLITDGIQSSGGGSTTFAYERNIGSVELHPVLYREFGSGPEVVPSVGGDEIVDHNTFSDIYATG